MKKPILILLSLALCLGLTACGHPSAPASAPETATPAPASAEAPPEAPAAPAAPDTDPGQQPGTPDPSQEEEPDMSKLTVTFNGHTYTAALADNSSARAFAQLLEDGGGSLTIDAHDYGNFEKVGDLPQSLPRNDETITTVPGDIILYLGTEITVYYAQNTWDFTRLGRLEGDLSQLREHLGDGNVSITFSLGG